MSNELVDIITCDEPQAFCGSLESTSESAWNSIVGGREDLGIPWKRYTYNKNVEISGFETMEDLANVSIGGPEKSFKYALLIPTRNMFAEEYFPQKALQWLIVRQTAIPDSTLRLFSNLKSSRWSYLSRTWHKIFENPIQNKKLEDFPANITSNDMSVIESKGKRNEITTAINIARQTFKTLKDVTVKIESDPEIIEMTTIRLIFTVSGAPENVLEDEILFKDRLYSSLSSKATEYIAVTYNWVN